MIKFVTRGGMKIEGRDVSNAQTPAHCLNIEIVKGRKLFVGKTMLFAKSDMTEVKAL